MNHLTFQVHSIDGLNFSCVVSNRVGWISFQRVHGRQIRKSAWSTHFNADEFNYAYREAVKRIEDREREARAAMPVSGSVPRLT